MTLGDNTRGILYMNVSMLAFTVNDTFVKAVTHSGMPLFQAIVLRGTITTIALIAIALHQNGRLNLWPPGPDRVFLPLRTLGEVVATLTFLFALTHMPLANLSAIMQSTPLAVTLMAALLLGAPIGWRRMVAILIGFGGVMLVVKPGAADFDEWSVVGMVSVAFVVLRDLATRKFSRGLPSTTGAIWASVSVLAMGLIGVIWQGWQPVSGVQAAQIVAAGGFLIFGYMFAIMVMRVGDISIVAPFRYMSLLWAILLGWLLFGTLPDQWTLLGGAIVVASGIYMLLREGKRRLESTPAD